MRWIGLLAATLTAAFTGQAGDRELIVCGWDEVFKLDVSDSGGTPQRVWSWRAANRPELPEAYRDKFRYTDECKPVAGNRILITASSDGVALVDQGGKTEFWARCANAHSAELLPGDRIVVACSTRETGGNRLAVFDATVPERELFSTELNSGHGAAWDAQRGILWALGGRELRSYSPADWDSPHPALRLDATYTLPEHGGHELVALDSSPSLAVTTSRSVWLFDRDARKFSPHPELRGLPGVKGISVHPRTGQIAYVQADLPDWWSDTIRFVHPERTVRLENQRIYKVRWVR